MTFESGEADNAMAALAGDTFRLLTAPSSFYGRRGGPIGGGGEMTAAAAGRTGGGEISLSARPPARPSIAYLWERSRAAV